MEGRGVGPEPHWKNLNPLNSHHEITTHPLLPIGKQNYPYPLPPPPPNTNPTPTVIIFSDIAVQ